jgi:hypothetical protein
VAQTGMTAATIQLTDVPIYLRESELYRALESDCSSVLEVPTHCLHHSEFPLNFAECTNLLCTLRYWGVLCHIYWKPLKIRS